MSRKMQFPYSKLKDNTQNIYKRYFVQFPYKSNVIDALDKQKTPYKQAP